MNEIYPLFVPGRIDISFFFKKNNTKQLWAQKKN